VRVYAVCALAVVAVVGKATGDLGVCVCAVLNRTRTTGGLFHSLCHMALTQYRLLKRHPHYAQYGHNIYSILPMRARYFDQYL
jgi:hypothetical protein